MITKFHLENFKSYSQATLPLASLTLLIGANASGKSNAIEGIHLLSGIATGQYLGDIFRTLQDEQEIRGSLDDLFYQGQFKSRTFTLGCSLDHAQPWDDLDITLMRGAKMLAVSEESISYAGAEFPLYRVEPGDNHQDDPEVSVAHSDFVENTVKPQIKCRRDQAIFTQLTTPARFGSRHKKASQVIPQVTQAFRETLEHILFLDPVLRRMRGYSPIADKELQGNGANLSGVLFELCEQQQQQDRVLEFVQALPEQDIRDIKFLKTPRDEVMVQLTESFGGQHRERDATILSDGTLRVLAVAAALLSVPRNSVIVIEEIDNGVHPSRAHTLLENIQRAAEKRDLRVLLSAHNPALLDALPLKAIPDVVYCYRDPNEGDSRLVRLQDLPDYPQVIAQGPVGNLMTRGILERYLKQPPRSPEQKQAAALAWLESLKAAQVAE